MFAICLEASHKKGMGHLFRMLNFAKYLEQKEQLFIFLINENGKVKEILELNKYQYEIVKLDDISSNWETTLIKKYNFNYWINDRLDTNEKHTKNVIQNNIKLITFDDLGSGAEYCDINICGLFFNKENIKGKKILRGIDYLILNPEIELYKKKRTKLKNILVTLGGSDTYGVTIKVIKLLKIYNIKATIHIGPSFEHLETLYKELNSDYQLVKFVPSLVKEFAKYDLAITGGGITPFEANASGLPCLIIANETFEILNAKYLQSLNSSLFLGYHENINKTVFQDIKKIDIQVMSENGFLKINTNAIEKIYEEITHL